jgi:hypothetical protein
MDLRGIPSNQREEEASLLAKVELQRPFDLARDPLFRAILMRLTDQEHRLYLAVHQIIIDGITAYQVLLPELVALYNAYSRGDSSPLPELPCHYCDFARWQRDYLQGDVLVTQLNYWRKQLQGELPILKWPNTPRPAQRTYHGLIRPFVLPAELSRKLKKLSQVEGVTLFTVLLTGFFALLHCYTGQDDLIVGTVSPSGRRHKNFQRLMGYFLNPVPLRLDLSQNPTYRELLIRGQRVIAAALSHDDMPFESLVEVLQPQPDPSRNPFFQVAASLEPSMPDLDPGWSLTPMDVESGGGRWDMYLVWDERETGIIGRVQYNPDLFELSAIQRMLEHQEVLLQAVVRDPERRLQDIRQLLA